MKKKTTKFLLTSLLVILVGVAAVIATTSAFAESDRIKICHATGSEKNKYIEITVDVSSIDEEKNKYLNGHGDHEEDIIPPFSYGSSSFEGKNWNELGTSIWENGCKIFNVDPTPEPTPTPTPETTSPPAVVPVLPQLPTEIVEEESVEEQVQNPIVEEVEPEIPQIVIPEREPEKAPERIPTKIDAGGGGMVKIPFLK